MKVALFGGSFDPVHSQHVALVKAAITHFSLDRVLIMPSFVAPHKLQGAASSGEHRLAMCRLAFSGIKEAEVCDYELRQGGTSYSYLTCRWLKEQFPDAERYLLLGADMLENFFLWRNPDDIVQNITLVACGRGERKVAELHERFAARFHTDFAELDFCGEELCSTAIRVFLAFHKRPEGLDEGVLQYILQNNLYTFAEARALALEKEERREHSFRVALLACARAKSLCVPFEKALLAAMLHDCGKYVPAASPLLEGFVPPRDVPAPVLHQYTGAYLAEHEFGITDEEVLNAIRYHTSGRENMSTLEKLIYLSDLLEESRTFDGVEELRRLFWEDLDACLVRALVEQVQHLKETKMPLYPLTLRAAEWYLAHETPKI